MDDYICRSEIRIHIHCCLGETLSEHFFFKDDGYCQCVHGRVRLKDFHLILNSGHSKSVDRVINSLLLHDEHCGLIESVDSHPMVDVQLDVIGLCVIADNHQKGGKCVGVIV